MKIVHVCETMQGGIASYLNELIPPQQQAYGADNVILLAPDSHVGTLSSLQDLSVISTFKRTSRKNGLIHLAIAYFKLIRRTRPDIVHAHSTFAGLVARLSRPVFWKTKIVYCPHGWAMDREQPAPVRMLTAKIEWALSYLCEKIICISEYERQVALDTGISAEKCVTIYNGIAPSVPEYTPVTWHDERLKVLFIGRLDRQKAIDVLLAAYEGIQDKVCLKLIGEAITGDESIDFGNHLFAERLGWLPPSEVAAWLEQCDLLAVPSRWEGFGLVAIEAMRMGRPVIASKVGGLAEIIEDGKSGLYIPVNDAAALREALLSLDKQNLAVMGKAARERFLAKFQSDIMIAKISDAYVELMTAPNSTKMPA